MLPGKKYCAVLIAAFTLTATCVLGQANSESGYLFHWNPFRDLGRNVPKNKKGIKIRLEAGLVFGYYYTDPHYTNNTSSQGGYELGAKFEIPFLYNSSILVGAEYYNLGLSFNSYYFAKGYSFLYVPSEEIYNHSIGFNELHFPIEYKAPFSSEKKHVRTLYALFGWVYRVLLYDNTLVTNINNGGFVFEGQNNLQYKYSLFTPYGSSVIVLGLGYQRNILKNGNAVYFELAYDYGISPVIYSGNGEGSNDVLFTANSLSLKIGLRL